MSKKAKINDCPLCGSYPTIGETTVFCTCGLALHQLDDENRTELQTRWDSLSLGDSHLLRKITAQRKEIKALVDLIDHHTTG